MLTWSVSVSIAQVWCMVDETCETEAGTLPDGQVFLEWTAIVPSHVKIPHCQTQAAPWEKFPPCGLWVCTKTQLGGRGQIHELGNCDTGAAQILRVNMTTLC
eukprot:4234448-Amphidinium_carterae.2